MSAQGTVAGLLGVVLLLSAGTVSAGPGDVYYIADQDADDVRELYRYDARSGEIAKVNPPLVEGGDLFRSEFDPKGRFVVYHADQDADGVLELYRYDLRSGVVTKLHPELVAGRRVETFDIAPR